MTTKPAQETEKSSLELLKTYDLKTLSCVDLNFVEKDMNSIEKVKNSVSSFVGHLLKELEIVKNDGIVYGVIPCSSDSPSILPRAKPIPAQKMETRWERFAKEKGIQKVKKKRVVWDEERGAYLPTFGYRNQGAAAKDKDLSEWIHEIKDDQDPSVDVVAEKRADKKDRVRKNEMQQRRNLEEGAAKVAGIDYRALRKDELRRRLGDAKRANASMGRFDSVQDGVKLKSGKRKQLQRAPIPSDPSRWLC